MKLSLVLWVSLMVGAPLVGHDAYLLPDEAQYNVFQEQPADSEESYCDCTQVVLLMRRVDRFIDKTLRQFSLLSDECLEKAITGKRD